MKPKLYLFLTSFSLLLFAFIQVFKDQGGIGRSPASSSFEYNEQTFIQSVITSRSAYKILKNVVDTSNSLFFINTDSYLCFELGKMEESLRLLNNLMANNQHVWPENQKLELDSFLKKYPVDMKEVCENYETREKKKYILNLGQNAKDAIASIYLDRDYGTNFREFYDQLEFDIEKNHERQIFNTMSSYLLKIDKSNLEQFKKDKRHKTCYELGKFFLPFYALNTSYLNMRDIKNSNILKKYGALGREISSLGPACHNEKIEISGKYKEISDKAKVLNKQL
jgi:hypothetical protein